MPSVIDLAHHGAQRVDGGGLEGGAVGGGLGRGRVEQQDRLLPLAAGDRGGDAGHGDRADDGGALAEGGRRLLAGVAVGGDLAGEGVQAQVPGLS